MLKSSVRNAWAVWILFKTCQESIPLFSRCYSSVAYNFQAPTIQSTCIRNATQSSGITQRKAGPPGVENGHPWAPKMAVVDWFYCRKHGIFDDLRSKPLTFESKPKNLCPPVAGTEMPSRRKKLPQTVRANGSEELEFSHLRINWIPSLPSNNARNILQLFQSAKT